MEYTPTALWQELEPAERQNDVRATVPDRLRELLVGRGWEATDAVDVLDLDDTPLEERDASGFVFEFMSWYGPQLVYTAPRVGLYSKTLSKNDPLYEQVNLVSAATNQWIVSTGYLEVCDSLWQDYLLNFCGVSVAERPTELGYDATSDGRNWPEVRRASYRNVWRDPLALTYEECMWWAERSVVDFDALIKHAKSDEDGGWNVDMLEGLPRKGVSSSYRPQSTTDSGEGGQGRSEIELIEVWVRGYCLDESKYTAKKGYHGTLFTLAVARPSGTSEDAPETVFARQPRPFRGPKNGPFYTQGVYRVSDSPFTLAPLVAIEEQRHENAVQVGAALRRMRTRRRIIATTADDPEFADKVNSGGDDECVSLREASGQRVDDLVGQYEIGGLTDQDLACVQFSSDLLRRVAGMSETQAGNAEGKATATEVESAQGNAGVRAERVKERWRAFHERVLYAVACYIATSDSVEITINADIARAAGVDVGEGNTGIRYRGGDLSWEDMARLSIEVDVTTMERATEAQAQQRMLQAHALVMDSMDRIMLFPDPEWWSSHFERIGDSLNVPHLGEHAGELAAGLAQVVAAQQQMQAQPAPAGGRPSVSVGFEGPTPRTTPRYGEGAPKAGQASGPGKALGVPSRMNGQQGPGGTA